MKRFLSLAALMTLLTGMSVVTATPAHSAVRSADTARLADSVEVFIDYTNDQGPPFYPQGDITGVGGGYEDDLVLLNLRVPGALDPEYDPNWNSSTKTTGIIWNLDVNGDSVKDYQVFYLGLSTGPEAVVEYDPTGTDVCDGDTMYTNFDPTGGDIFVGFPASCIGDPASFRLNGFLAYTGSSGTSTDAAPDSGFCCSLIEGDPAPPPPPPPAAPVVDQPVTTAGNHSGYWMLTERGDIFSFGSAQNLGSELATTVKRTHVEPTPSGNGYWILAESGAVHTKGDAKWFGSALNVLPKGETAESLSATPTGNGYWIFTNRGRVLNFGDAAHYGDMSTVQLNGAILGSVATPSGKGYWMVGSDGGVFSFGDAKFFGSTGNMKLNKPVMALAADPDGAGYWLVASDGGIFAFDAPFFGSMGGTPLNKPISGMVPGSGGYMMVSEDGGIFSFGNVAFHGSLGATPPTSRVISVALQP